MERVQFQQEQMLAELKDLVEKDIFTKAESKQIMKKRTQFETALVRRVAKKSDFLRYAAYEMGLEQLRRKRVDRLKIPDGPATVSDYALVRRQFHIFERALKKFKADVGLWIQYIDVAKREGAYTLVGRVSARAIQLHPNTPALYILAAAHEMAQGSPSGARTLLQRGIRINPESVDMWREYVRMELAFIESLRRRWDVLGLDHKGKGKEEDLSHVAQAEEDLLAADADQGAEARAAIMQGAIVKSVIVSAAQALDKTELFEALIAVIHEFPLADELARVLLDQVYGLLRAARPRDARAARILAERYLAGDLAGEALVDGVQQANEEMLTLCGAGPETMFEAYVNLIAALCNRVVDSSLQLYLVSSVRGLIVRIGGGSPALLAGHIRLLSRWSGESRERVVQRGREYVARVPGSGVVEAALEEVLVGAGGE
ncbi:U3 small nucleolar RNA-associated protein 6-domain-containing protein [Mycena rosella]|uniref:U3 small nucleolar RNA-associated protein 6-domain-containing protein n=1 Tax=Mycena rosella TaxID=1033263 RepID=A0AAD7GH39_MYCRO|nr:U3 small nucleolar RNA-associated protein 6-domain-containing protein [Mycena rosella]